MTQATAPRPLRADARRNRERVLCAARAVFSEQGREAQMDDVARQAMVGVGTVYRHFPTKEALIDALVEEAFGRLLVVAKAQAAREDDAWDALVTTLWAGAEILSADRALSEIMAETSGRPVAVDPETQRQMNETMDVLLHRARDAGALRPDVILDDIPMVMCGIGSANCKPHVVPDAWRRHLSIIIDGLRAPNASGTLPSS